MQYRLPSALLLLATAASCFVATTATAQSSGRYLTWANRPNTTTPADVRVATNPLPNNFIARRVAPSQAGPRPEMQAPAPSMMASQGLTPANAWIGPRVSPAYAPSTPNPVVYAAAEMVGTGMNPYAPPAMTAPAAAASYPVSTYPAAAAPVVDPLPIRHEAPVYSSPASAPAMPVRQPMAAAAAPAPIPAPAPTPVPVADPMAPRRDARIFQLQQPAQGEQQASAAPSAAPAGAGQNGPRYYSVHREAGRTPDPTPIPEPVYFDSVSMDLAQPPEVELPLRDAQGRRRVVANVDPSLP